jgi:signal transduction histidine kinase/tetratricopeptide (TPR) repeat protein
MSKYTAFLLFFFLFTQFLFAQNRSLIYTLETELKTVSDSSRLIEINRQLMMEYEIFNISKSFEYGNSLWNLGLLRSDKKAMLEASYFMGRICYVNLNDSEKAINWQLKALELAKTIKDSTRISDVAYTLAWIMKGNGNKERAIQHYLIADKVAYERKDFTMIAMVNIGLGDLEDDQSKKIEYYLKALQVAETSNTFLDTINWVTALLNIAAATEASDKKKALRYYEKVYSLLEEKTKTSDDLNLVSMFANACLKLEKYDECIMIGNILANSGSRTGSDSYFITEGLRLLAEAYFGDGEDSLAFKTAMRYVALTDSLNQKKFSAQAQNRVLTIQTELDLQQKAQELELLQTKTKYENRLAYVLSLVVFLLIVIVSYLYRQRLRENKQNQKLAQLNQTKDKLLSIISHDVRSPIQALQNIINLFEQDIANKEDVKTVTRQVNASILGMARGLDNLFYWAQNQQQELKSYPELFDLTKLVSTQIDLHAPNAAQKNVNLKNTLVEAYLIYADILHVRLIINNILGNAIKFTPVNGEVHIEFYQKSEKEAALFIQNMGEPINEMDIPKILDSSIRYTRLGTKGEPGSGLGLSLTRDLMLLNQGNLEIQSIPNIGTRIVLVFRLDKG